MSPIDPSSSILDAFRASVAEYVSKALEISFEKAYSGIDLGKKGVDFTVAVPRFGLKSKPQDLTLKIQSQVRRLTLSLWSSANHKIGVWKLHLLRAFLKLIHVSVYT